VPDAGRHDAGLPPDGGLCAPSTCTAPWALQTSYSLPAYAPQGAVVANLDDDCGDDVALADGTYVDVFKSRGGLPTPGSYLAVPAGARQLAAADLNQDGRKDLVITHGASGQVTVLLAVDAGTFAAPSTFQVNGQPDRIAAADLDGDGVVDLALTDLVDGRVGVLLGTGTGTFGTPTWWPCLLSQPAGTDSVGSLVITDLNRDGTPDLVVNLGRPVGGIATYLGLGHGTFAAPVGSQLYGSMAVADFNLDGKPDLFVHNAVSLGLGDGTFGSPIGAGVIGGLAAAGDFNGDCVPDVAVTNYAGGVQVLQGQGNGSFAPNAAVYALFSSPTGLVVGDLGCDGRADLVLYLAALASNPFSVLTSTCQ
jgi:hypothetical protein